MKRLMAILAGCALLLAAAAGWAQGADGTLVYGTTDKVTDMDPASAYDFHTWEIFQNVELGPPGLHSGDHEHRPRPRHGIHGQRGGR